MGCGQSKIHLYPRKSKSKANGKKGGHADSDAETDEDEGHIEDAEKCPNREREKNDEDDEASNTDIPNADEEVAINLLRAKNLSLLQSQEISSSQQNFFRMLDQKIEEGPDYDSASETEIALEEARLNALVQHWESASLTASICSSTSRSLQTTPIRQVTLSKQLVTQTRSGNLLQPTNVPMQQQQLQQHILQQQQQQQQQLHHQQQFLQQQQQQQLPPPPPPPMGAAISTAAEFLPHGVNVVAMTAHQQQQQQQPQSINLNTTTAGPLRLQAHTQQMLQQTNQQQQQQQQQMLLAHMTPKMLQQTMSGGGIVPMSMPMPMPMQHQMPPDAATTVTTANTSNATLALMQQQQQQQAPGYAHLLSLPGSGTASTIPIMGKPNASPKRLPDGRLLATGTGLPQGSTTATVPQQMPHAAQYVNTSMMAQPSVASYINGGGNVIGGRMPQPPPTLSMQMAYYGHSTALQATSAVLPTQQQQQTAIATTNAAQQQQQQQQQQSLEQQYQQQQQQQQQLEQQLTTPISQNQSQQQQQQQQQQPTSSIYYGEMMHSMQATPPPPPPTEYKFPPAISVQRLAPQVQRQLRETQELIKDSCPQLYAAGYGSPGPPIRNPNRNPTRSSSRPTLETQFSQELS